MILDAGATHHAAARLEIARGRAEGVAEVLRASRTVIAVLKSFAGRRLESPARGRAVGAEAAK